MQSATHITIKLLLPDSVSFLSLKLVIFFAASSTTSFCVMTKPCWFFIDTGYTNLKCHLNAQTSYWLMFPGCYLKCSPIGQDSMLTIRADWLVVLQPGDLGGGVSIHVTLHLSCFVDQDCDLVRQVAVCSPDGRRHWRSIEMHNEFDLKILFSPPQFCRTDR